MGWTVLYIAFGLVALWLLGEVLLQYKARLRWRLLAFAGFLGVVVGVLLAYVPVIVVGTLAFATGQTFVTLSFRRGFSTGWAIGGSPGASRRRKGRGEGAAVREPTLEVSDLEVAEPDAPAGYDRPPAAPPAPSVYEPQPLPDDTGQYGVYGATGYDPNGQAHQDQDQGHDADPAAQPQYAAYDPYTGYGRPQAEDPYAGTYDYGTGEQSYAAYSDPYIGTTNGTPSYGYDAYGNGDGDGYDSQGGQQGYADPYAQSHGADTYDTGAYTTDTPPGGVWVPQQRDAEQYPPLPPEQPTGPAPYGNGYDTGQNEQYR
ncbi:MULTISPECIES: US12 family protein [Streptomyces]|uniref:US12 family protein n=1 Tax=Streptomyces TaxID=1883 RepID=UPI0004C9137E|nr:MULTISPECIES: US12 family protein [Streptomyces]MDX2916499.1 US12 family protein [Streptomyces sp. NE06-03C]